jgi:hypothetical protein
MYDVVPGALLRLREADIVSLAGLTIASVGQEYCRTGAVHSTRRQGARLSGIVDVPDIPSKETALHTNGATKAKEAGSQGAVGRYNVEVEVRDGSSWVATCTCDQHTSICTHAAALLYQWVSHPTTFTSALTSQVAPIVSAVKSTGSNRAQDTRSGLSEAKRSAFQSPAPIASGERSEARFNPSAPKQVGNVAEMLAQSGLSELRGIAREYDIATAGLNKQQLVEAIAGALQQSEVVRRMAGKLEKPQRQLLAALTLAGGSMNDEDLRGLYERFSLGSPGQLQSTLLALQEKAFILRASVNSSLQQRIGLSGSSLDLNWRVPTEVCNALHVMLPVTSFDFEASSNGDKPEPAIHLAESNDLLANLLLVARALDGYAVERKEKRTERSGTGSMVRALNVTTTDGSISIPPPGSISSSSLLETLQRAVPRSTAFLRFAVRLLRMAEILYKDEATTPCLRVLPNAARLLLGPGHSDVMRELFMHWLNQPGYEELFDLHEEGVQLRCRTTPLNQPALRSGELETENSEARQALIALLAQAPLDRWINFPAFARFVYRLNPLFLQRRQQQFSSPHWWIEQEEGHPLHPTQLNDWLSAEGRYLARLLQGPLHWWGITDIVLSPDERLLAFRLTPMASILTGDIAEQRRVEEPFTSVPQGAQLTSGHTSEDISASMITAVDDGKLLVPSTSSCWEVIELIENFAEVAGVQDGQLCYQLTPKSLGDAFSRGQSPVSLLQLLREVAKQTSGSIYSRNTRQESRPVEQMLKRLEQRIANYGRIRLYTDASLLEVADTAVLRELSALTSIDEQVVHTVHPTLMILKKQGGERLVEELKRRGQVPLLHHEVG